MPRSSPPVPSRRKLTEEKPTLAAVTDGRALLPEAVKALRLGDVTLTTQVGQGVRQSAPRGVVEEVADDEIEIDATTWGKARRLARAKYRVKKYGILRNVEDHDMNFLEANAVRKPTATLYEKQLASVRRSAACPSSGYTHMACATGGPAGTPSRRFER